MKNKHLSIFSFCLLALSYHTVNAQTKGVKFLELGEKKEPSINKFLTWDSLGKRHQSRPEELDIKFEFHFQNTTKNEIQIKRTFTSCGCTVAKLPKTPWVIKPGQKGSIPITMDVRGKSGTIEKESTIVTDLGNVILTTKVAIGAIRNINKPARKRSKEERAANLKLAAQNRQAIFQNNCVECHVNPTKGKRGRQLYATACGICHDAENRASFVTELRSISKGKDQAYWDQWIRDSKPGTLMPAFAKKHGGPLDDSQIKSLVAYLVRIFPRELKTKQALLKSTNKKESSIK
ncbi:MAG: hypothetical protein CMO77_03600 [Verrucomicrobiales bacterium]|nr:hypothetical protein [Verrucomicrobiales bacterium]